MKFELEEYEIPWENHILLVTICLIAFFAQQCVRYGMKSQTN